MKQSLVLFLILFALTIRVYPLNNSQLEAIQAVNNTLKKRPLIEAVKRQRIDSLLHCAAVDQAPYQLYKKLYEEYRSYNYDTALIYVSQMAQEATLQQKPEVDLCRAFVYLSGGLFTEAYEILRSWQSTDSTLMETYYITYARLLWDMCDHAGGEIGEEYNKQANEYIRLLLNNILPSDTARYWYYRSALDLREKMYDRGIERGKLALQASCIDEHFRAILCSTLGFLYHIQENDDQAFCLFAQAAVSDILSSTYETIALRNLAELLYKENEIDLAEQYIRLAAQDAERYHARHRQVGIAQILPIIEQQKLQVAHHQKRLAWALLILAALFLCMLTVGFVIVIQKNRTIESTQSKIDRSNQSLLEANKLKEQLLGTLLVGQSQYLSAVQAYQQQVKQLALNRQWQSLLSIPKNADAHLQRAQLDRQLDTVLLSIYPSFVHDFQTLLQANAPLEVQTEQQLNTSMRIFALIRLGISHNEVIAEILGYSINTIYSYKTRIISQSGLSPEAFYDTLMQIPSFAQKNE